MEQEYPIGTDYLQNGSQHTRGCGRFKRSQIMRGRKLHRLHKLRLFTRFLLPEINEHAYTVANNSAGEITNIAEIDFLAVEVRMCAQFFHEQLRRDTLARQRRTFRKRVR